MSASAERSLQRYARLAGFLYLFVIAAGVLPMALTSGMFVPDNFVLTAEGVAASELAYRAAMTSLIVASLSAVFLAAAFYALLKSVDANLALFAFAFRVAEATLGGVGVIIRLVAFGNYASAAAGPGAPARAVASALLSSGYVASLSLGIVYFSVSSILFFYLLLKSGYVPRALAWLGIAGSIASLLLGFAYVLFPSLATALEMAGFAPIAVAEVGTGLWLLIRGADLTRWSQGRTG
jgi:hypothetical protein